MHIDCKFTRNNYLLRYDVLHTYFQSYQREEVLLYFVYCCASQAAFYEKVLKREKEHGIENKRVRTFPSPDSKTM